MRKGRHKVMTIEPVGEINDAISANPKEMVIELTQLLGTVKLRKLVVLLKDVIDETGYGDVKIVIAEGKVQVLKAEHSYK